MVFPKARLVVSAVLFLLWIVFLFYLAMTAGDPIVVSRPQILVADVCVLAQIDDDNGRPARHIRVTQVLWARDNDPGLLGEKLEFDELPDLGKAQGWAGADVYLVALTKSHDGKRVRYALTPLPPMPGFLPTQTVDLLDAGAAKEKVADHIEKILHLSADQAKQLTADAPVMLKRFVPREAAFRLKQDLDKLGAEVRLRDYETRIYQASDDVVRQFQTLK